MFVYDCDEVYPYKLVEVDADEEQKDLLEEDAEEDVDLSDLVEDEDEDSDSEDSD